MNPDHYIRQYGCWCCKNAILDSQDNRDLWEFWCKRHTFWTDEYGICHDFGYDAVNDKGVS
jgi:hypothetical protein